MPTDKSSFLNRRAVEFVTLATVHCLLPGNARTALADESSDASSAFRIERLSCKTPGLEKSVPYLWMQSVGRDASQRAPLLIYLYGAGGSIDDYNLRRPAYDRLRAALAQHGYCIVVPELGPNHFMNAAARSILDAIVKAICDEQAVDSERIHIMGTSMGGGSALVYASHRPNTIRSACSLMGMTDLAQWRQERDGVAAILDRAMGGSPQQEPKAYRQASALHRVAAFARWPVLLIHGDRDQVVRQSHSRELADALRQRGYLAVYRIQRGVGHEDRVVAGLSDLIVRFFDSPPSRGAANTAP